MMVWAARRAMGLALLISVTAFTAATAFHNEITAAGYIDVRDTSCFPCHVTWAPPLQEMAILTPATGVTGSVGEQVEYTLRIQNPWLNEIIRMEPSLDASNAPSLGFVTDRQPELGRVYEGTVPAASPEDPTGARSAHVLVDVEAGVTDLIITLEPTNADPNLGPDLIMNLYPSREEPSGNPAESADEAGAGGAESFHATGSSEISEYGFGTWVVEAEVKGALQMGGLGGLVEAPFTVTVDKYYNATGETIQFLQRDEIVGPSETTAFTWTLLVLGAPGADESIRLNANVTSFYEHDDSSTDDYAYTHQFVDVPVVAAPEGGVSFDLDTTTVVVTTADVGVSMSRISEVVGYLSAFLVLASVYTGGMFGKASRRGLNHVFQSAKRRVAFHNFLSYGIILAAAVHTIIFLWPGLEGNYHWTQGLIWGTVAILCMFGLGITGAMQVPLIRRWNYAVWRWSHLGLSFAVILFTVVHILLDGGNFGTVQDAVNWTNPLDPRDV